MTGTDSDCERVTTGLFHEFLRFLRISVGSVFGGDLDVIFDAGQFAEFGFYGDALRVSVFDNLFGNSDVFLEDAYTRESELWEEYENY